MQPLPLPSGLKNLGAAESVTVDRRKWIRIQAPALDNPNAAGADQIAYYYTLRDKDGNLIPGTTDKKDTTVKLKPGSSQEGGFPQKLFPPNPMSLRL